MKRVLFLINIIILLVVFAQCAVYDNPLFAPTNVEASSGEFAKKVIITWDVVERAVGYRIYRSNTEDDFYELIGDTSNSHFMDTDLTDTKNYYYKVSAYNRYEESMKSPAVVGSLKAVIDTPSNFNASDGEFRDGIFLSWDSIITADVYHIYKSSDPTGSYSYLTSVYTNSYKDQSISSSDFDTYYYKLYAENSEGYSNYTNGEGGYVKELSAPVNISASDSVYTDKIEITWDSVADAQEYKIFRSKTVDGFFKEIALTSETIYDDSEIKDIDIYYYKIKSVDSFGTSGFSTSENGSLDNVFDASVSGLYASDSVYRDHVQLTWDELIGADGYQIFRSSSETGEYIFIESTTGNTYSDFDLDTNEPLNYYYKVNAYNSTGYSGFSNIDSGKIKGLQTPTNISADQGAYRNKITITWNIVDEADEYYLYRSASNITGFAKIAVIPSTTTHYEDDDPALSSTKTYFYKLKSVDAYGESVYSDTAEGWLKALNIPSGVEASDGDYRDKIYITWSSTYDASGYKIYRSTSLNGTYNYIDSSSVNNYSDYSVSSYTTIYYYKIKAYDSHGESDFSQADEGYLETLPAPINLSASDGDYSYKIELDWDSVSGATGYYIYRSTSQYSGFVMISDTTNLYYNDTFNENNDTFYYYKVSAYDNFSEGDLSDYNRGYLKKLYPPSGIDASDGIYGNKILITWDSISDAIEYKIYRSTSSNGYFTHIDTTSNTHYNDYTTSADTYYYRIKSHDGYILSELSDDYDSGYISREYEEATYINIEEWNEHSISAGDTEWYYFNATADKYYDIFWNDYDSNSSSSNICDIIVSGYSEDMKTIYFTEMDGNHYQSPETIRADESGRIYLEVKGFSDTDSGYFSIKPDEVNLKKERK